jgi:hypothetical protein
MDRCPVCGRPIQQASMGRPRVYCRPACRQAAYKRRHPLGEHLIRDMGLAGRPSLMELLAEAGIHDPPRVHVG